MKTTISIVLALCLCSMAGTIYAQNPKFVATVTKKTVAVGERFQVSFKLDGGGDAFKGPDFKGLSVLSGPNPSSSMQIINGAVSQSISYNYIVQADKPGRYTIGAASIKAGGKKLKTKPIKIKAVKGEASTATNEQKSQQQQIKEFLDQNISLKVTASKRNVYQGESLVVSYKLYSRADVINVGWPITPSFNGFWSQNIELEQRRFRREVVDGVQYKVLDVHKAILYPQRSGDLGIEPVDLELTARVRLQGGRRRSIFDVFGDNIRDVQHTVKSRRLNIKVKGLPQNNVPAGFTGAVGEFTMNAFVDKPQTSVNEPVTLKIKISGKGNLKLIDMPEPSIPQDFESFEPKVSDKIQGSSGSRTYEILLIPRYSGTFKIPPIEFAYFDLAQKRYVKQSSEEFVITVEKGDGTTVSPSVSGVAKEDVQLIGKDIRFIKSDATTLRRANEYFFGSFGFYALSIAPAFFFLGFIFYRRRHQELQSNQTLLRNKKATKIAKKRLGAAQQALKEQDQEQFYDAVSKALWGYLSDKLSIQFADLSQDTALEALSKFGAPEDVTQRLKATLDHCEYARFAPGGDSSERERFYHEAADLITKLESVIK